VPVEEYADFEQCVRNDLAYVRERVEELAERLGGIEGRLDALEKGQRKVMKRLDKQTKYLNNLVRRVSETVGLGEGE